MTKHHQEKEKKETKKENKEILKKTNH